VSDKEEIKKLKRIITEGNSIINNLIVRNQCFYIDFKNGNIEKASEWIISYLEDAGLLPEDKGQASNLFFENNNVDDLCKKEN